MFLLVLFLAACSRPAVDVAPKAPSGAIKPQMLRAPTLARKQCLETIARVIQRDEDIRFGDSVARNLFGLGDPEKPKPDWWLIITGTDWCKAIVTRNHLLMPDGSLYYVWMLSKPIITGEATRRRLADLFKCAEPFIRKGEDPPSSVCGLPPNQEGKQ
jgi:hypothetical protein